MAHDAAVAARTADLGRHLSALGCLVDCYGDSPAVRRSYANDRFNTDVAPADFVSLKINGSTWLLR